MEFLNVLAAAVAGFGVGAIWYTALSKPWLADSGVACDANGNPQSRYGMAGAFGGGFLCTLIVAGMLRHMLAASGITTLGGAIVSGLGVGAFFITPWLLMNILYVGRPLRLAAIDGGYAIAACAVMGAVLVLF